MTRKSFYLFLIAFFLSTSATAQLKNFDVTATFPLVVKDPSNLHGYRFAAGYHPPCLTWKNTQLYFDLGYGYWWVPDATIYSSIHIYTFAPILRTYFHVGPMFSPFFEVSVGLTYLTKTNLVTQKLGMHFCFQDQVGLGVAFGKEQRLAVSLSGLHYSNASLAAHNSGITVPVILNINYRF